MVQWHGPFVFLREAFSPHLLHRPQPGVRARHARILRKIMDFVRLLTGYCQHLCLPFNSNFEAAF